MTQQRSEFLALARLPDSNISELCRRFGISRKTAYKWPKPDSVEDRPRRPKNSPKRSDTALET